MRKDTYTHTQRKNKEERVVFKYTDSPKADNCASQPGFSIHTAESGLQVSYYKNIVHLIAPAEPSKHSRTFKMLPDFKIQTTKSGNLMILSHDVISKCNF